jgi:hypothetical protein
MLFIFSQGCGAGFFLRAPAPGPCFFSSGSGSGSKEPKYPAPTGSGSPALMKGYDFSIRPFNVLDQLEII